MASWKKVIVSGSQAHLQSITASGGVSASGDLSITGISTLTGRLSAGGAISTTNITASGNISSSGNLIVTGNITASGLPFSTTPQIVGFNTTTGGLSYFDTSSIVAGAAAAVQTFKTISVGGVSLEADSSTDTLTIASGSFGGVATTRNNLRLSGSQDDTLTISFLDSPTFTQITASGNISSSAGLIGGTLTTSGGATVGGDLAVNGGDITTTSTGTATIFNTNASQIDMGGVASIINVGGDATQTNFNGSVQLGNGNGDQTTLGGSATDTVIVQGLFTIGNNLLNSNLIPTFGNSVLIGSSSKAIQSIVVNQITASALPQTAPGSRQVLMIDPITGAVVRVTAAELSGSVGVDSFRTISIGGVGGSGGPVVADSSTDTLNISSSDANLTVVGDSGTDTITFDFSNSPIFTHITASGNISSSGNLTVTGNSTIGGTLGVTGLLSANGALTTTNLTASGNISSSGNLTVTGTSTLTGRLTANGAITTTNITASGNISSSAGLIGGTLTTSGAGTIGDNLTVNGGSIITAAAVNIGAAATTMNIGSTSGTTTVKNNLTVDGNLTVNGETTILDTTNLTVEDKFIILAHGSGSQTPISEGGIIIEGGTADKGQAFLFNSGSTVGSTGRWGLAADVHMTASNVTPTDYIMSVSSSAADPTLAPTYGSASAGFGNVHINTQSKTIWMYI